MCEAQGWNSGHTHAVTIPADHFISEEGCQESVEQKGRNSQHRKYKPGFGYN